MYVMLRLSVPSDAFVAAATGVAQVHRPRNFCAVQSSCNHLKGVAYHAECVLRACAPPGGRTSRLGAGDVANRVEGDDLSRRELRSGFRRELRKVEGQHLAEPKRLSDSERPVPELRLGSDQLDVHALPGSVP